MKELQKKIRKQYRKQRVNKYIGYILLLCYIVMSAALVVQAADLDMLPLVYLVVISMIFVLLGVLFFLMHKKLVSSIIASLLSVIMIFLCGMGAYYIRKATNVLDAVTTTGEQMDVISVYVMNDDPAKTLEDIKEYEIGVVRAVGGETSGETNQEYGSDVGQENQNGTVQGNVKNTNQENLDKTIAHLEEMLHTTLDILETDNMFAMMDELRSQQVQAIILNEAYVGMISDREGYEWVTSDIRRITGVEHVIKLNIQPMIPKAVPETFVMYLSGIDTYGGVSARSRSDVNILAVINTRTKNVLLLSTPRDYYVPFNVTGGARDKLTHAGIYGVDASIDALEQLYGIEVDYYLRLNFSGFIDIIDALGGIEVYSDYDFTVVPIRTYQKGMNQLTGLEALAFARERYSFPEGDFQRAKNQMEVIRAVIEKCASSSMLVNYTLVMEAVSGSFETSMTQQQIASLVKMQLSDMAQWNVTSYTVDGHSMYAETFSMPGTELYVIEPDYATVETAKEMIRAVYEGDSLGTTAE